MNFSLQLIQSNNDEFKSLKMDDINSELKSMMISLQGKHEDFLMKREHDLKGITKDDIENETDDYIESFGVLELTYDDIKGYLDTKIDFGWMDDKKPINEESFDYYLEKLCLRTDGLIIFRGDTAVVGRSGMLDFTMFFSKYLSQLCPEYLDENFNEISEIDFFKKNKDNKDQYGYSLSSLIYYTN